MRVIEPGHRYLLDIYDTADTGSNLTGIPLDFMKRIGAMYPGNSGDPHAGTNCQEVLRAEIDRVKYLHNQIKDPRNISILIHMRKALLLFEQRAAERHGRKLPRLSLNSIETIETCKTCGHIFCTCGNEPDFA